MYTIIAQSVASTFIFPNLNSCKSLNPLFFFFSNPKPKQPLIQFFLFLYICEVNAGERQEAKVLFHSQYQQCHLHFCFILPTKVWNQKKKTQNYKTNRLGGQSTSHLIHNGINFKVLWCLQPILQPRMSKLQNYQTCNLWNGGLPEFTGFKSHFIIAILVDLQDIFNYISQMWLKKVKKSHQ